MTTYIRISHSELSGFWLEAMTGGSMDVQIGPADGWVKKGRKFVPVGYPTREEAEAALAKRRPQ